MIGFSSAPFFSSGAPELGAPGAFVGVAGLHGLASQRRCLRGGRGDGWLRVVEVFLECSWVCELEEFLFFILELGGWMDIRCFEKCGRR